MPLDEDGNGIDPLDGRAGMSRKNKRFTGPLLDGIPLIGLLTYDEGHGYEFTELGRYNKLT